MSKPTLGYPFSWATNQHNIFDSKKNPITNCSFAPYGVRTSGLSIWSPCSTNRATPSPLDTGTEPSPWIPHVKHRRGRGWRTVLLVAITHGPRGVAECHHQSLSCSCWLVLVTAAAPSVAPGARPLPSPARPLHTHSLSAWHCSPECLRGASQTEL